MLNKLVFGKHEALRVVAIRMLQSGDVKTLYPNDKFRIHEGKDAIELVPIGFEKYTALDKIMTHPNFKDRRPYVFGDSGPDALLSKAAFEKYDGQGRPVGNHFPAGFEECTSHPLKDIDHVWQHLGRLRDTFRNQKFIHDQIMNARRSGMFVPKVR